MSTILVDNLTGKTSAGSITVTSEGGAATQSLQQGLAKCWAKFDLSGTATLNDSLNVSALSDLGTGNAQLTVVSAFNNATYAVTALSQYQNNTGQTIAEGPSDAATTSFEIFTRANDASLFDADINSAVVHGDLA